MEEYKPTYLDDVEEARNRPDKSVLAIRTMCPEKLLASPFPEQVKHLWLDLSYRFCDYLDTHKFLYKKDCDCPQFDTCNKCSWPEKYTETLCRDIVNFNNLETLVLVDVKLNCELWTQFAQNSKYLTYIKLDSGQDSDCGDHFMFDGEHDSTISKMDGLEAIFKIPTLKKVSLSWLNLIFFPKGPSNITHIEMHKIRGYEDMKTESYESFSNNFSSHTNLTHVDITRRCQYPFKFSTLQLHKLEKLEDLTYEGSFDKEDLESLKVVLKLPSLKEIAIDTNTYYKEKNTFRFKLTLNDKKWVINDNTVDSLEVMDTLPIEQKQELY